MLQKTQLFFVCLMGAASASTRWQIAKTILEIWNEPWHDIPNKMSVHPMKTQISLGIRPVWSASLLFAQWVAKDQSFLHVDSEDSDQTGRMPRLIGVFAGRTLSLLLLSCLKWRIPVPGNPSKSCSVKFRNFSKYQEALMSPGGNQLIGKHSCHTWNVISLSLWYN